MKNTQLAKNDKEVSLSHTEVTAAVNTEAIRYHCTSTMYGELHSQTVGQNKSFLASLLRCCHRSRSSEYTKAPKALPHNRESARRRRYQDTQRHAWDTSVQEANAGRMRVTSAWTTQDSKEDYVLKKKKKKE